MMPIDTPRLILRDWREEDIEPFERHTNTPAVMRWLGGVREKGVLEGMIRNRLMRWQEDRGFTLWAVERKADGALLGFCGLKIADGKNSSVVGEVEVGWRFREDAWGQGYAKEAASASLGAAFDLLGAERVVALTVQGNEASWGLMKRLGMRRRGDLDYIDPDWSATMNPVIIYEIRREEWGDEPRRLSGVHSARPSPGVRGPGGTADR
jgi:RimJ/RimL family protein N-acetyltransferase